MPCDAKRISCEKPFTRSRIQISKTGLDFSGSRKISHSMFLDTYVVSKFLPTQKLLTFSFLAANAGAQSFNQGGHGGGLSGSGKYMTNQLTLRSEPEINL